MPNSEQNAIWIILAKVNMTAYFRYFPRATMTDGSAFLATAQYCPNLRPCFLQSPGADGGPSARIVI